MAPRGQHVGLPVPRLRVTGTGEELNQQLEKAGRVADFLEFAELMALDALVREESCGAHFRGAHDGSLHATLPREVVQLAVELGWGELHPIAQMGMRAPTLIMCYSPRDEVELEAVWALINISYVFARRGLADARAATDSPLLV